jgi:hypothetical protein
MSLIKKRDVPGYLANRRGISLLEPQPAGSLNPAASPKVSPAAGTSNTPDFKQDFSREHSGASHPVTPIAIVHGSAADRLPAKPKTTQS